MSDYLVDYLEQKQKAEHYMNQEVEKRLKQYECIGKIRDCKTSIILQGFCTLLFMSAGIHYAHKNSFIIPFMAAPSAAHAASRLCINVSQKRKWTKKLEELCKE